MSKLSHLNQEHVEEGKQTKTGEECQQIHAVWNDLSKVWTLPVIYNLGFKEPARFNELKRRILGISATSLTERLTELELRHIVERKVYPETPPRVEYSLTKKGWELHSFLCQLANWVIRWAEEEKNHTQQEEPAKTVELEARSAPRKT